MSTAVLFVYIFSANPGLIEQDNERQFSLTV